MTNEEILKNVINKALKNNLDWLGWSMCTNVQQITSNLFVFYMPQDGHASEITISYQEIIFSHEFADAFWNWNVCSNCGSEQGKCDGCRSVIIKASAYFLKEMVLEEDRIKYLEKFL